jgi:hypothetical protein
VQSTTLYLLAARGELPPLDAAIFADTQYEPEKVYGHLDWLITEGARLGGAPILRVTKGNLRADTLQHQVAGGRGSGAAKRFASMPFFIEGEVSNTTSWGMVRRQCTREYKLEPIRKQVRRLAGLKPGEVVGDKVHVEQWVGISADEIGRMRQSRDYWITLRYPLVLDLKPAWNRNDCQRWLKREYPDHPVPRSACIACPFHSNAEWRMIRDCFPAEWADAVAFDRDIRVMAKMRGRAYLHAARVPLDQAPIDDDDPSQGTLFSCGVCDT